MKQHDDFSCDTSKWSWEMLCRERPNGMPAVVYEYERRINETERSSLTQTKTPKHDDFSCDTSKWSDEKLQKERKNGMPAVIYECERRKAGSDGVDEEELYLGPGIR